LTESNPTFDADSGAPRILTGEHLLYDEAGGFVEVPAISGEHDAVSGLFFMDVIREGGVTSYVGAYSSTGANRAYRLVLFPRVPTPALTLFLCFTSSGPGCVDDDGSRPTPGHVRRTQGAPGPGPHELRAVGGPNQVAAAPRRERTCVLLVERAAMLRENRRLH
jgi:hypothetical protein